MEPLGNISGRQEICDEVLVKNPQSSPKNSALKLMLQKKCLNIFRRYETNSFFYYLAFDFVSQVLELEGVGIKEAIGPLVPVGDLDGGGQATLCATSSGSCRSSSCGGC